MKKGWSLKSSIVSCVLFLSLQVFAQTSTTLIESPNLNGNVHFSVQSSEDGVCIDLGFISAAKGSAQSSGDAIGPVILVDSQGLVTAGDVVTATHGNWISEIICITASGKTSPVSPSLIDHPMNPGSQILFSSQSSEDGICKIEGFSKAAKGSGSLDDSAVGSVLIAGSDGSIIGGDVVTPQHGQWISALICF